MHRILVFILIIILVAPQLYAASDKCVQTEQKLDSAIEQMEKYCQGDFFSEKKCEKYERKVFQLEEKAEKYCAPAQPF
jgi:hypothetical protein